MRKSAVTDHRRSTHRRKGFTIIETLLVVGIGGLLLTAISSMLFSLVALTQSLREQPYFDAHCDSLASFLNSAFAEVYTDIKVDEPNPNNAKSASGIEWTDPPGAALTGDPVLSFQSLAAFPFLFDEEYGTPQRFQIWLVWSKRDGLELQWSNEEIKEEEIDGYRRFLLSPWVTRMTYWFFDDPNQSWEEAEAGGGPPTVELGTPDFIDLEFESPDGRKRMRRILLPEPIEAFPVP